jgi:hypothetical protein
LKGSAGSFPCGAKDGAKEKYKGKVGKNRFGVVATPYFDTATSRGGSGISCKPNIRSILVLILEKHEQDEI